MFLFRDLDIVSSAMLLICQQELPSCQLKFLQLKVCSLHLCVDVKGELNDVLLYFWQMVREKYWTCDSWSPQSQK